MSLIESSSEEVLSRNIATEVNAGRSPEQAAAIAYSVQRANDDENLFEPAVPGLTLEEINSKNRTLWSVGS